MALGFFIYSTGSRSGLFGSDSPDPASANAVESTASPTAIPQVIDTYVYEDGTPATGDFSKSSARNSGWEDDDHGSGDHDEDGDQDEDDEHDDDRGGDDHDEEED
jgi:hypothetical protein